MPEPQRPGEPEPPTQPMTAREDLSLSLPDAVAAARQPMDPPTAEAPTVRAATAPATATVTLLPQQHTPRVPRAAARPGMTVGGRHVDWTTAALALATTLVLGVLLAALLMRAAAGRDQQAEQGTVGASPRTLQAPEIVGVGTSDGGGADSVSPPVPVTAGAQAPETTDTSVGGQVSPPAYGSGGSDENVTSSPDSSQTDDSGSGSKRYGERDAAAQPHEADETDRGDRNENKDAEKADKERAKRQAEQEREHEKRNAETEREREKRDAEREREKRDRELDRKRRRD